MVKKIKRRITVLGTIKSEFTMKLPNFKEELPVETDASVPQLSIDYISKILAPKHKSSSTYMKEFFSRFREMETVSF